MLLADNMKRLALLFTAIAMCGVAWISTPPAEQVWHIADASIAQEHTFSDWFHSFSSGLFAIRVVGSLSEPTLLETPLGPIDLPKGDLDFIAFASEAWLSTATLRYSPGQSTTGDLKITGCLGSNSAWVNRPPPSALPRLYTGGWTAYYPSTDKKAWAGGFHHGAKSGEFIYWDEAGNITHREEWENGRKKG